ncbi:MAG: DUF5714 domain-containing protein [Methanocorpusculum sp.]|nr:DUF5714 domain-containing protein [Methanocorpusculum sp.]
MVNIYSKCPVCGSDVVQGYDLVERVCDICGKNFISNSYCKNGHYICNKCASVQYFDIIDQFTKNTKIVDPIEMADKIMCLPESNLVGCKHSIVVFASVLTAFKNNGGHVKDFEKVKKEITLKTVFCPTSMCKLGGFCGIPLAMGIAMRTALSDDMDEDLRTDLSNKLTGYCMGHTGNQNNTGNKNCCVRNTYLTILYASKFISNNLWVEIPLPKIIVCKYHMGNPRCNKEACILYHGLNTDKSNGFIK